MISSVLVANRGEIAVRVIRACRDAGIRSIAVFSDPDRLAPHVRLADEAYPLGGTTAAESYLRIDRLLDTAARSGAEAVHPGYGFLAENAEFSEACGQAGLRFIGPPPEAMRRLGSKTAARQTMQAAGVPVVPGMLEPLPDVEQAAAVAAEIGYPVALKAVLGGGGKGMRVVRSAREIAAAFRLAAGEALTSFGDASLYIERYVERPRHVEIQFLVDSFGNAIHLGERDCSIQRRHQKLVEESPSPAVDLDLRARMGEVAVRGALAAGYVNAGTAEFLLAPDGSFYFLEVNARLQVEHPVTELVTGLDLVRLQFEIASGLPLSIAQDDVRWRGHAVECRVYAEDPDNGFLPSTGRIVGLREQDGTGVRIDGALELHQDVSLHYDPLLAKLIVWGPDRATAIERLRRALNEYLVLGVKTDLPLHRFLVDHPAFQAGAVDTAFLEREWRPGLAIDDSTAELAAIVAALDADARTASQRSGGLPPATGQRVDEPVSGWRLLSRPGRRSAP
ncbi:MAG: ATP-grasp domain-containing protein [Chloroflexi bacterium]|nr:ATP-grasp domain-containing protein [Chloroflexota bacterium]